MARPARTTLRDDAPEIAAELVNPADALLGCGSSKPVKWRCPKGHVYTARPYNRTNAKHPTGCPVCSGKAVVAGENDLATTDPDVAALLADPSLARTLTRASNKKVEWRCDEGHAWAAPVSRLTMQRSRCPYCSGRYAVAGKSDLATTHPGLAAEMVDQGLATRLKAGSHKKVEWRCGKGHIWTNTINNRVEHDQGCPYCSGRYAVAGKSDLATTHPEYARTLVDAGLATRLSAGSDKRVEWRCSANPEHTWTTGVRNRLQSPVDKGCPVCNNKRIVAGDNDLATTHPELAGELKDKRQAGLVCAGSARRLTWVCPDCGFEWDAAPSWRARGGTGCPACAKHSPSRKERELGDALAALGLTITRNGRGVLPGRQELDILVPERHVAIEFNGCRWHSELSGKPKTYHKDKLEACAKEGWRLIFVWEDDWDRRRDVVLRGLAHKLGRIGRLPDVLPANHNPKAWQTAYARKLRIIEISNREARPFLEANHIQGAVTASRIFALTDADGDVRACLCLRSSASCSRMRRPAGTWEIQRYATLGLVPGGFSRLLAAAEAALGDELSRWVSFAAADISDGGLYRACGFYADHTMPPDYKYVGNRNHWVREPKEKYQKARIRKMKGFVFEDGWTETQAMHANGMYRIYDAGKTCWAKDVR